VRADCRVYLRALGPITYEVSGNLGLLHEFIRILDLMRAQLAAECLARRAPGHFMRTGYKMIGAA
jgi:hypothetical protein